MVLVEAHDRYLVFSQEPKGAPNLGRLAASAARFFDTTVQPLEQGDSFVRMRIATSRQSIEGEFRIEARDTTQDDLEGARVAEARGLAGGMAALAEKCRTVWQISGAGAGLPSEAAILTLCAICASVALGPVMPPDLSTLFGVRGAIERRDKVLLR